VLVWWGSSIVYSQKIVEANESSDSHSPRRSILIIPYDHISKAYLSISVFDNVESRLEGGE
jgi:hypothetical protein